MYRRPRLLRIGLVLLLACAIFLFPYLLFNKKPAASVKNNGTKSAHINQKVSKHSIKTVKKVGNVAEPINWLLPTGGPYPAIGPNDQVWINVSKEKQRVYIMKDNQVIYTMICSTGLDTSPDTTTPVGTFYIQRERGTSFYNPNEQEGAEYYVSWKNHGEFLFHSVATDKNGNVIPSEAMKLGQKASHGCIRLTVPDAKWIYDNIKYETKVVIG